MHKHNGTRILGFRITGQRLLTILTVLAGIALIVYLYLTGGRLTTLPQP